jgi:hypothetical protein
MGLTIWLPEMQVMRNLRSLGGPGRRVEVEDIRDERGCLQGGAGLGDEQ